MWILIVNYKSARTPQLPNYDSGVLVLRISRAAQWRIMPKHSWIAQYMTTWARNQVIVTGLFNFRSTIRNRKSYDTEQGSPCRSTWERGPQVRNGEVGMVATAYLHVIISASTFACRGLGAWISAQLILSRSFRVQSKAPRQICVRWSEIFQGSSGTWKYFPPVISLKGKVLWCLSQFKWAILMWGNIRQPKKLL